MDSLKNISELVWKLFEYATASKALI